MTSRHASLMDVDVAEEYRNRGVATFLFGESIRTLVTHQFVTFLEAQAAEDDLPTLRMLNRFGFQQVESGAIFCKQ